jgi:hypothetical protein
VAAAAELADPKVALALADTTIYNRLNKVIKRTLREQSTLGSYSDKTGGALEPYQRWLALEVRRYTVHPVRNRLLRQGLHVNEQHRQHNNNNNSRDNIIR